MPRVEIDKVDPPPSGRYLGWKAAPVFSLMADHTAVDHAYSLLDCNPDNRQS